MFGRWITGLIVVALAVGVWALWPREDANTTTTTSAIGATTTTADTTTTTNATTTITGSGQDPDIIETVVEAEDLLRELWFGWFEGIYLQDEDRIKEVVASQSQLDAAIDQFGVMTFVEPPSLDAFRFEDTEILRSDEICLAVWSEVTATDFTSVTFNGVHVFRSVSGTWKMISIWELRGDLWEQDCDAQLG